MALGCCAVPYEDMLAFAAMMALAPACCVASSSRERRVGRCHIRVGPRKRGGQVGRCLGGARVELLPRQLQPEREVGKGH